METLVNNATNERDVAEDWAAILELCDRANSSTAEAQSAVKLLIRRLQHRNVSVQLKAVKVADALAKNGNLLVRQEIASRAFLDVLQAKLASSSTHASLRAFVLECIAAWASEFAATPQLGYMGDVLKSLQAQGHDFSAVRPVESAAGPVAGPTKTPAADREALKEQEDLQLALALSLSAAEAATIPPKASPKRPQAPLFYVQALYDFAAREEGELPLTRGDLIDVWDATTYQSWWKGHCGDRIGIFPSNYVQRLSDERARALIDSPVAGGNVAESQAAAPAIAHDANAGVTDRLRHEEAFVAEQLARLPEFAALLAQTDPRQHSLSENERLLKLHGDLVLVRPRLLHVIEEHRRKQTELAGVQSTLVKFLGLHQALCDQARQLGSFPSTHYPPPSAHHPPPSAYPPPSVHHPPPSAYHPPPSHH